MNINNVNILDYDPFISSGDEIRLSVIMQLLTNRQ